MQIVITNDDGWGTEGLNVLIRQMCKLGEVTVVVPDGVRSSMSNAISMNKRLDFYPLPQPSYATFSESVRKNLRVFLTNGTPSDCVKLALNVLFKGDASRIDLLVSGINHGSNSSINIIYSGTMGACFVACEQGIHSIGFSSVDDSPTADFSAFEEHILPITRTLLARTWHAGLCYNVNAPAGVIKGVRYTRQAKGHWENEIELRHDEKKQPYYWLVGSYVNDERDSDETDETALAQNFISIQPCCIDMTDYQAFYDLQQANRPQ